MPGRIRTIKPEVLDDDAVDLTDTEWRLWVSTWVLADDHGNLRARERWLAAQVWNDSSRDVRTPLHGLLSKRRLFPYSVSGEHYVHIRNWEKHQRIDNASKPRVPTPDQDDGTWNQELTDILTDFRREPPSSSAILGEPPLARAPAHPRRETTDPDHRPRPRPPITEPAATLAVLDPPDTGVHRKTKARSRIPEDWHPTPDTIARFAEQGVDATAHVGEFVDYWRGEGTPKADWEATFRVRMRALLDAGRAKALAPAPYVPPKPPSAEQAAQASERIAATVASLASPKLFDPKDMLPTPKGKIA